MVWCVCALMRGVGDGTIALSRGQTCERKLTGVATNSDTSAVSSSFFLLCGLGGFGGGTIPRVVRMVPYRTIPYFSWQQQLHQNLVWYHTT